MSYHQKEVIRVILFYLIIPFFVTKYVDKQEKKMKNEYQIMWTDLACFVFFMLYLYWYFYFESSVKIGSSSDTSFRYVFRYYCRNFIGLVCGILYSFMVNFRQMRKYLVELKLFKYRVLLFILLFVGELFMISCFYKLM